MSTDILLPKIGFSMNEGTVQNWLVEDGGQAVEGQPLYELESDKSVTEVEAPASGTLRIKVQAGDEFEIDLPALGAPLTNTLAIEPGGHSPGGTAAL